MIIAERMIGVVLMLIPADIDCGRGCGAILMILGAGGRSLPPWITTCFNYSYETISFCCFYHYILVGLGLSIKRIFKRCPFHKLI